MTAATTARRDHLEPLWDRIDRNRLRTGIFVTLFVLAAAVTGAAVVALFGGFLGVVLVAPSGFDDYFRLLPYLILGALVAGAALAALHVVRMLTNPERRLPREFGAVRSAPGELLPTKAALHDMSLAAGYEFPPPLWVIPDCERINAFAIGMSQASTVVGVTQGFIDRLGADSQRAVFANLMARVRSGDVMSATAISSVMGPIWASRAAGLRRQEEKQDEPDRRMVMPDGMVIGGEARSAGVVGGFIIGLLSVIVTEALMAGHERAAFAASEKADAEGLLLLKDPQAMLNALSEVLDANNTVPGAGEAYSMLFYCWAGFGYAPEDDPEMERIGRLREVIGAAGA